MHEVYLQYGVYYLALRVHGKLLDGSDVSVKVLVDRHSTDRSVSERRVSVRTKPAQPVAHTKPAELAAAGKTCPRIQSKVG